MAATAPKKTTPKTPTVTPVAKLEPITKRISNLEEGVVRGNARVARLEKQVADSGRELSDRIAAIETALNG